MISFVPVHRRKDLLPLFRTNEYLHLIIDALIEESLGEALVDDLTNPTIGLLVHSGLVFLGGSIDNSVMSEILERIPEKHLVFIPNREWELKLELHFGDKLHRYPRTKFSSETLNIIDMRKIQEDLPQDMTLEEFNTTTIYELPETAKRIVFLLFPTLDDFLKNNFGFYIKHDDTIVSLALAATPLYSNDFEIHIETHPDYRRKRLASIVCARLIEHSLDKGYVPHWDADNEPSAGLAMKLGFSKPEKYNAYYWKDE